MPGESYIIHIAENGYIIRPAGSQNDIDAPMQIASDGTLEENLKALRVSQKVTQVLESPVKAPVVGKASNFMDDAIAAMAAMYSGPDSVLTDPSYEAAKEKMLADMRAEKLGPMGKIPPKNRWGL